MRYWNITTIKESQHGLVGMGDAVYKYDNLFTEIQYKIGDGDWTVVTGAEAKKMGFEIFMDESDSKLIKIKQIASDACGIPYFRLYEKTGREEVVFARYLAIWLMMKQFNYTDAQGGDLFNKHRCTALHAIKVVNIDSKYFKVNQRTWKSRFLIKLRAEKIISPEEYKTLLNPEID